MEQQSNKRIHLALLGAAHSLNHSLFVIAPPLLSLIKTNLNVSNSEIGFVSMIASLIYGVGALVGGPLGDRIGEPETITVSLAFAGLSTFIMIAAGFTHAIVIYAIALILMAAWASLYHPTANSLISKAFKGRVSETMGLHGVGGTIGVVLAPTIAWFIGASLGWHWAFVTFGLLCILLAFLFVGRSRRTRSEKGSRGTILGALKIHDLWVLLTFNVAIGLFMKGVELFFPLYLQQNRAIPPEGAAIAYTLLLLAGVPAQWIGGNTADKFGSRKVLIVTSFGITVSLLSLLFIPIHLLGIGIFIALYGLCFYAHQPALNSLTGFLSPENQRGAVYGIFFFTSFGLGSLSQSIAGYLADLYGFDSAFYLFTAFALIALLLSFMLPEKREI